MGANFRLSFALNCLTAFSLYLEQEPHLHAVDALIEKMQRDPTDAKVQIESCKSLRTFANGTKGANKKTQKTWDAMAQAALNNVKDKHVALACVEGFGAIHSNLNLLPLLDTTHALEALIGVARAHRHDRDVQMMVPGVIGDACFNASSWTIAKMRHLGGIDVVFDTLNDFQGDGSVMLNAWLSLMHFTHHGELAKDVAHHGGPFKGIQYMVQQMQAYPTPHYAENSKHLGLRGAIMGAMEGLLANDDTNNSTARAVAKSGYVQQAISAMQTEWNMRTTQHVGCLSLKWIANRSVETIPSLLESGILPIIAKDLDVFHDDDPTPFDGNITLGMLFEVIPPCSDVLLSIAMVNHANRIAMVKLGIPKALISVRPDMGPYAEVALGAICMDSFCV